MKVKLQCFVLVGGALLALAIYVVRGMFTHTFNELTKHRWL